MMLKDRVILISNVTHFAGMPTSKVLSGMSATVVAHDRSFTNDVVRKAFEANNTGITALASQDPKSLAESVIKRFGRIDALINNDIGDAKRAKIEDADVKDFRSALENMTVAPFAMASAVTPIMKTQKSGKIVFVTSATPLRGLANYSMYVTARGATNALALTLAQELASENIQVNALAPNYVESTTYFPQELLDNPETLCKITKNIPLRRLAKPHEIGEAIAFLVSPSSDFITGHIVPFAGGWA